MAHVQENAVLLLMYPALLDNPLWRDVLRSIVERNRHSFSDELVRRSSSPASSASASASASARATLETCQALVFQEMVRLIVGHETAAVSPAAAPSTALAGGESAAARALASWQREERQQWPRWVHMGVRRQPRAEEVDASASDGGLRYEGYADLLNILHAQQVPERAAPSDLALFLRIHPQALKPNSELFLVRHSPHTLSHPLTHA